MAGQPLAAQDGEWGALGTLQRTQFGARGTACEQHHADATREPFAHALHGDRHLSFGDAQRRRDLCTTEAVAQVQVEHLAVRWVQPVRGLGEQGAKLLLVHQLVGAGTVGGHRRLLVGLGELQPVDPSVPAVHLAACDRVQPWPHQRRVAQLVQSLDREHERVLHDVAGVGVAAGLPTGVVEQSVGVAVVERGEGLLVALQGAANELAVLHCAATLGDARVARMLTPV